MFIFDGEGGAEYMLRQMVGTDTGVLELQVYPGSVEEAREFCKSNPHAIFTDGMVVLLQPQMVMCAACSAQFIVTREEAAVRFAASYDGGWFCEECSKI